VLNPGLAEPGGRVNVIASGFPARASLLVRLRTSRKGAGTVVAHGRTTGDGMMTAGFTMPGNETTSNATVIVAQPGGSEATAQLATPGGMGSVTIDGKTAGKPGDVVTVSAAGFGPGERVNVFWGRVAGTPAATLTADPSGAIAHEP